MKWRILEGFGRVREERGSEIAEYALTVPILLSLLWGIWVVGRAYNVYQSLTRAAMEGARVAVANTCATCGNSGVGNAAVTGAIQHALLASSIDPTVGGDFRCANTPSNPSITYGALNTTVPQEYGVTITVCYPYRFEIPFVSPRRFGNRINLTTTVQMRQEN